MLVFLEDHIDKGISNQAVHNAASEIDLYVLRLDGVPIADALSWAKHRSLLRSVNKKMGEWSQLSRLDALIKKDEIAVSGATSWYMDVP